MNVKYKRFLALLLITSFVLGTLTGCNQLINSEKGALVIESKPVAGGVLHLASIEPKSLNPLTVNSQSYKDIVPLLFNSLYEMDSTGMPKALLANDETYTGNGDSCTVSIREGLKWSSGEDVTLKDIKYSFDLLKSQADSMYGSLVKDIESCRIKDNTILFKFKNNQPLKKECLTFPIVRNGTKNEKKGISTSGLYKVTEYVNLDRMTLRVNESYKLGEKPYIPTVEVMFINDPEVFVTAFQSQEVDVVNIRSFDWSKYEEIRGTEAKEYFTGEMEILGFNTNHELLRDSRMRKAIAYGIDRVKLMEKYVINNGSVSDVPILPGTWLSDAGSLSYQLSYSESKALLADAKENPLKPIVTPTPTLSTPTPTLTPTPTITPTPKVTQTKKNVRIKFELLVNEENINRMKEAEEIRDSLKEIGIDLTIQKLSFPLYNDRIRTGNYELYLGAAELPAIQDFSDFMEAASPLYVKTLTENKAFNDAKTANSSISEEELLNASKSFGKTFREDLPYLPLYHKKGALILSGSIRGIGETSRYNVFDNIEDWYFEKSKN